MAASDNKHPHLELKRERPVTVRRARASFPGADIPDDPQRHGVNLRSRLGNAREAAANDIGGYDERLLIKITLSGKVSPEDISKASGGVEIVSQEDDTLILAFATETQLEEFSAKLASLAIGEQVTYKNLLYALRDFDRWTPEDRTGWALARFGFPKEESFVIDAELWPLSKRGDAERLVAVFGDWVVDSGGEVVDSVRQPYLTIFRIRCGRGLADKLLNHRDVRTLDLPPRIGLERSLLFTDVQQLNEIPSPPSGAPGVVVLDSGLVTGHPVLSPAIGDAQSFLPGASASDDHGHGTIVSGIALYDDVADCLRNRSFIPQLRIFSGRVLNEQNEGDTGLIHNQIERAVVYFVENYDCRIFNLSYADCNKPYQGRHVSGLAVTLDALCREHNVLFVVPTGNYEGDDNHPLDWLGEYPNYLTETSSVLLDPAPALNVITVGSLSRYERNERWPDDPGYRAVARSGQPSPFTRHGPSVNGAIKPDLVDYGGNWIVDLRAGGRLRSGQQGVGELSTSRDYAAGHPFCEDSGTSYAAPRVANAAASLFKELPSATVDLCRALLITHARVPKACDGLFDGDEKAILNLTGYGLVDRITLYQSLEHCVTLWAEEAIENRRHHFFEIPIPEEFWSSGKRRREITVTLAYRPAVRTTRVDYRAAVINYQFVQADSLEDVVRSFDAAIDREAADRIKERTSGRRNSATARSRGTVQSSTWVFNQASHIMRNCSWFVVVTRNDPKWGENLSLEREPYALTVKLDDSLAHQLRLTSRLFAQVEARIRERVRVRANL